MSTALHSRQNVSYRSKQQSIRVAKSGTVCVCAAPTTLCKFKSVPHNVLAAMCCCQCVYTIYFVLPSFRVLELCYTRCVSVAVHCALVHNKWHLVLTIDLCASRFPSAWIIISIIIINSNIPRDIHTMRRPS